jgi:anti-sigma B factor antagonist
MVLAPKGVLATAGDATPDGALFSAVDPALNEPGHGPVLVRLPDEIDISNEEQLRDMLTRALSDAAETLIVDARGTTFLGCSGVNVLVEAHQRAAAAGARLRLVATTAAVMRALKLTGADRVLDVYSSVTSALADPR